MVDKYIRLHYNIIVPKEHTNTSKEEMKMEKNRRYEIKKTALNWYFIIDTVTNEIVAETSGYGLDLYKQIFGC